MDFYRQSVENIIQVRVYMGYFYTFYDAENGFKIVEKGKYSEMPFYQEDFPIEIPMVGEPYNCTGLLSRETAIKVQKHMETNKNLFTDLMDRNHTDTLVFRIE